MTPGDATTGFLHLLFAAALIGAGFGIWKLIKLAFIGIVLAVCTVVDKEEI